ncbi:zinc-ribbon domain protein [Tasmannia lanceolata]|uniref:zinc-ribbon domain protein n=1 Tax=Tasmannia lanceolata TaxID=3420 RepID=UPI0040632C9F
MFFFFVGGIEQQVRQVLQAKAVRCIRCGSYADLVQYENVLKLFFIPVWRWPGREPVIYCPNCSLFFPKGFSLPPPPGEVSRTPPLLSHALRCKSCDSIVDPDFRFCPFCGSSL